MNRWVLAMVIVSLSASSIVKPLKTAPEAPVASDLVLSFADSETPSPTPTASPSPSPTPTVTALSTPETFFVSQVVAVSASVAVAAVGFFVYFKKYKT